MNETEPQLFRMVTPKERALYYKKEWSLDQVPMFILKDLSRREWAFDHDGNGPSDRKNYYTDPRDLKDFIKTTAPFAVYTSTAFYKNPAKMDGWQGAELVFDIDAKDLPLKTCGHPQGVICPICLEDGKEVARNLLLILKEDLGFKRPFIIYSGRGYHIRVMDPEIFELDSKGREELLNYILGNVKDLDGPIPLPTWRVLLTWLTYYLLRASKEELQVAGVKRGFDKLRREAVQITAELYRGERPKGLKEETIRALLQDSIKRSQGLLDRKVTVDVKRLIRLPSSLHSKAGLRATYIGHTKDSLKKFNPLVHAVPKFRKEEVTTAYERWLEGRKGVG